MAENGAPAEANGTSSGVTNGHAPPDLDPYAALAGSLAGRLLLPGDPAFDSEGCRVWAKSPVTSKRPAAVVQARGTRDVIAAVKFARAQGLPLSVKSGGHSQVNACLVEGGLVVDLSLMRSVHVDPAARTATVDGGALLGDVDSETGLHGLAVPLGMAPVTGMGLALAGGTGIASRMLGATCDHIVALQVVTAAGELVVADKTQNPELLWAMAGAGPALGVAVRITFRLHDVSDCVGGHMMFRDDPEHNTFRAIARWMVRQGVPNPHYGQNLIRVLHPQMGPMLACMMAYLGPDSREAKEAFVQPLHDLGPVVDTYGRDSYYEVQQTFGPPFKHAPVDKFEWGTGGGVIPGQETDEMINAFCECIDLNPDERAPLSIFDFDLWGGALRASAAPLGWKDHNIGFFMIPSWLDPAHSEECIGVARAIKAKLARFCTSDNYVNISSEDPSSRLAVRVGGEANLVRLRAAKAAWDPDNVFASHHFAGLVA